jgi:hypothetical protein
MTLLAYRPLARGGAATEAEPEGSEAGADNPGPLDWALAAAALVALVYPLLVFDDFARRVVRPTGLDVVLGVVAVLLALEATRRTVGWVLPAASSTSASPPSGPARRPPPAAPPPWPGSCSGRCRGRGWRPPSPSGRWPGRCCAAPATRPTRAAGSCRRRDRGHPVAAHPGRGRLHHRRVPGDLLSAGAAVRDHPDAALLPGHHPRHRDGQPPLRHPRGRRRHQAAGLAAAPLRSLPRSTRPSLSWCSGWPCR